MTDLPAPQNDDGSLNNQPGYVGFRLTGKNPALWQQLRPKLIVHVELIITQLTEQDSSLNWLREEAKELGSLALEHAKARLRKAGVEVEKLEAEIAALYADREKKLAEARKINADAEAAEIANSMKKLLAALGFTKAMLIGDESEEAILFGRQIDAMIDAIKLASEV